MNPIVVAAVQRTLNTLDTDDLVALNLAATMPGFNFSQLRCYNQIKHFLTENGGASLHSETIKAIRLTTYQRLA